MRPLQLKHAQRHFAVSRDDAGVPHITAESWREAIYGLGYMHALDRPTQMLFARSIAAGRSAETIADRAELAETDRFFRRAGLSLRLQEEVRQLDDDTFAQLTAYCEGVNDGMQESGRTLAMWATGFQPTPWNQEAVLLIGNLLSYGGLAVGQQQNERLLLELIQAGVDDALMTELFAPQLDHADFELLRRVKISRQLTDEALELIIDLPRLAGSNAWAVAPSRSASGGALLASDPHLEINRLPAIWYEAVLHWDSHYVLGASLPGCPLFAVARTERLAWGVTYMKGDTSDYFVEDCRRSDTAWQYRRGDDWHDFAVREETIAHKGANPGNAADLSQSARHVGQRPGAERSRTLSVDRLDGQRSGRGAFDRRLAEDHRGEQRGRRDGLGPRMPPADAVLDFRRSRRSYRFARMRAFSATA